MSGSEKPAIIGGPKVRTSPMPSRFALAGDDDQAILEVLRFYRDRGLDPGFQGHFEELYTNAFVRYLACDGFADAVSTGTAAIFVALAALRLPEGSHVVVSPVTDPGTVNAIILNRLIPVVADSMPDSFNMGAEEFEARITDRTKAVLVVHLGGSPAPIQHIRQSAEQRGILVVEDCSQAHGAMVDGRRVGTFGDVSAFSTMYRKAHATGGCGGVIFTKEEKLYGMIRACADRGKPFLAPGFNEKDPGSFLFPALNFNCDEISAALGVRSLARLDDTINRRLAFAVEVEKALKECSKTTRLLSPQGGDSPFFLPVTVDLNKLKCGKVEFAEAIKAEGIEINPDYRYVVTEWPWVRPYLYDEFNAENACAFRRKSFNILFNEHYGRKEVADIAQAVVKIERHYRIG